MVRIFTFFLCTKTFYEKEKENSVTELFEAIVLQAMQCC